MQQNDWNQWKKGTMGAVVLAAGKGTRMKSARPKVLHELLGLPMLWYVHTAIGAVVDAQDQWTVVGFGREQVQEACTGYAGHFIPQDQQLGTGHAVQMAWPAVQESGCEWCLVLNGDVPLIRPESLGQLVSACWEQGAALGFASIEPEDPTGYGRVLRHKDGSVAAVVEEKDLAEHGVDRPLKEVNAGLYCLHVPLLGRYLQGLSRNNAQGEYYITELIDLCVQDGERVVAVNYGRDDAFLGVNSPRELVACETLLQQRINSQLLDSGVILRNSDQVRISPLAHIQPGVEITGPVEIYGHTVIEAESRIGSNVWVKDVQVGPGSQVLEFSHLDQAQVDEKCQVGPFARLRPGTHLKARAKVGNFVEVKKAVLEVGSKANHLSYIGDAFVGEGSNIGAGTITCNYDGRRKHITVIGERSFIGSNAALIAPVTIGKNSIVGAGSAVSKDVPDNTLAVTRAKQKNLPRRSASAVDEEN
ncbi:MAG: bifunctional UDP-N-acetylglucosamine diphosphorylase/glucosamine-1-phosphate N-acetyltransferase GlmU [Desulfovermiculus sp.]|nr:bifunctional UDP-N-acetylglucosamine diphosphorylase/glucosamine-1-phosphate N-acetyltransferase GlmU [Desulfovermiculus sp.]